jgi:hypothetical protein
VNDCTSTCLLVRDSPPFVFVARLTAHFEHSIPRKIMDVGLGSSTTDRKTSIARPFMTGKAIDFRRKQVLIFLLSASLLISLQ